MRIGVLRVVHKTEGTCVTSQNRGGHGDHSFGQAVHLLCGWYIDKLERQQGKAERVKKNITIPFGTRTQHPWKWWSGCWEGGTSGNVDYRSP
jgi:hypothetical protein